MEAPAAGSADNRPGLRALSPLSGLVSEKRGFFILWGNAYPSCSGRSPWGSSEWISFDSDRWIAYNENI